MAISEESRHRLFQRLEEVIGADEAVILMEHLPPVGWADVATKRDIEALAVATKRDIEGLAAATHGEIELARRDTEAMGDRLEARFERELRAMSWRFVVAVISSMSVAMAVIPVTLSLLKG